MCQLLTMYLTITQNSTSLFKAVNVLVSGFFKPKFLNTNKTYGSCSLILQGETIAFIFAFMPFT